ncbi:MAG: amidohydrolase [Deltaproteobacteria bacterium]|nr:amidohydrolase [Deltaproteobacteria bacterium]
MKTRALPLFVTGWVLLAFLAGCTGDSDSSADRSADLAIVNATVFTSDPARPWAEAVAVQDDRIIFVGEDAGADRFITADTRVVNARGRMLTPGFIDSHCHVLWIGALQSMMTKELYKAVSVDEVADLVRAQAAGYPDDALVMGVGWQYAYIPRQMPNKEMGDAIIADRPMLLMSYDGNTGWLNTEAVRQLVSRNATAFRHLDPAVDETGEYSGVLMHFHAFNPLDFYTIDELGPGMKSRMFAAMAAMLDQALSFGLTAFNDVQLYRSFLPLLIEFHDEGGLERVRARGSYYVGSHSLEDEDGLRANLEYWQSLDNPRGDEHLFLGDSAKLYIEGVLDSYTALLLEPYADRPDTCGEATWTQENFNHVVALLDGMGLQCCTHAIGDGGIRRVLNAYENAAEINGPRNARHRLEHCELPEPTEDLPRLARLGVLAAMQPAQFFGNANGEIRLGFDRVQRYDPWKSLQDVGVDLSFGSDWAAGPLNPMYGLFVAVHRLNHEFSDAWGPEQKIGIEDALGHYTMGSARALMLEDRIGSIEIGKLADLVLFNIDLREVASDRFMIEHPLTIEGLEVSGWDDFVDMTVVGGQAVYERM